MLGVTLTHKLTLTYTLTLTLTLTLALTLTLTLAISRRDAMACGTLLGLGDRLSPIGNFCIWVSVSGQG